MTKENENKSILSKESAQEQLQSFCDFYDLDTQDMNERMKAAHEEARVRLVRHIQKGRLEIDGPKVIHTTADGKRLECATLQGKHKVEMAKCGSEDTNVRIYALYASLTGVHPSAVHKLTGVDLSIVECIGMLFLQV